MVRRTIRKGTGASGSAPVPQAAPGGNGPDDDDPPQQADVLPESYGQTRVVLLPVDPYLVFAYWELDPSDLAKARARLGRKNPKFRAALRFYDVSGVRWEGANANSSFDVDVDLRTGNWYVHLWSPGKSYFVDLGIKTEDGRFVSITRSGVAHTPRAEPSPKVEEGVGARRLEGGEAPPPQEQESVAGTGPAQPASHQAGPAEPISPEEGPPSAATQPGAEMLRSELAESYALRKWPLPPGDKTEPAVESSARAETGYSLDLTAVNETSLAFGCSSGQRGRAEGKVQREW